MKEKRAYIPVLGNVVLVLLGLVVALVLVEMMLRAFPNWIPSEVRVNPPARRVKDFINETYDLRQSDGDLYHLMRGKVVPLSPDQDKVVAHVNMVTDAYGFRNSSPEKATYSVVALGDSFTRASGVAFSWPQKLAEYSGNDVFNLGEVGFGPQDELKVLRQFGLRKQPQWVVMAYFEGNDLYDAGAYDQAHPLILFRFGRYILNRGIKAWQENGSGSSQTAFVPTYRYPIQLRINQNELEMVFFSSYISWLSLSEEEIAASQNYHLVEETILQVPKLCEEANARFLLVYVPSKEHVYLPYLDDPETIEQVFADVPGIELDDAGYLQFMSTTVTPELVRQHMDDQAHLLADFAAAHNILFLDLTPAFQEEAGAGVELYYPFDTHWNQLGHDLAAEVIYNYLKEMLANYERFSQGY